MFTVNDNANRYSQKYVGTIDDKSEPVLETIKSVVRAVNENLRHQEDYHYRVKLQGRGVDPDKKVAYIEKLKKEGRRFYEKNFYQQIPHDVAKKFDVYVYREYNR